MQYQVKTRIEPAGTIVLHDLPFHEGEPVLVVVKTCLPQVEKQSYSLRGLPLEYANPFDPVADDEWSVLQ